MVNIILCEIRYVRPGEYGVRLREYEFPSTKDVGSVEFR